MRGCAEQERQAETETGDHLPHGSFLEDTLESERFKSLQSLSPGCQTFHHVCVLEKISPLTVIVAHADAGNNSQLLYVVQTDYFFGAFDEFAPQTLVLALGVVAGAELEEFSVRMQFADEGAIADFFCGFARMFIEYA